jgi:hypothetical protein
MKLNEICVILKTSKVTEYFLKILMFFFLVIFFHSMEFEGKGKLLKPLATKCKIPSTLLHPSHYSGVETRFLPK